MRCWMGYVAVAGMLLVSSARADWPQFLGPQRDGISNEKGLLRAFPPEGPRVLWTVEVGVGFGGASIVGNEVYFLDRAGEKDVIRCLDFATGKESWRYEYDAPGKFGGGYPGSRAMPTVDEKYVYTIGPFGHLTCLDRQTHKLVWGKHLVNDFGGAGTPQWQVSQSPVLYRDMLIVAPLTREAGLAALDKATGKVVWQSSELGNMEYASPFLTKIGGVDQAVILCKGGRIVGVEAATGKFLWDFDKWHCRIPVPSPTDLGEGRFFISGGYGAGCTMFQVAQSGGRWTSKPLFKNNNCQSHVHNVLFYRDRLWANSNGNNKGLMCLDTSGNVLWQHGNYDIGGLMIADGIVYILGGNGGELTMAEASPDGYKELGKAKLLDGQQVWAPLSLSEGKLIIRDQKRMKCVAVK